MVAFYSPADQELYKKYQYVPQEKYRLGFTAPNTEVQKIENTFGTLQLMLLLVAVVRIIITVCWFFSFWF